MQRAKTIGKTQTSRGIPISRSNLPNPAQLNPNGHNNSSLVNQNAQQNMLLPNVASFPVPLVDNVRPIGMMPQFNVALAPYRPNVVIHNQGRPPSPPERQDGQRPIMEAMAMPNPVYAPQGPNMVVNNQVRPLPLPRGPPAQVIHGQDPQKVQVILDQAMQHLGFDVGNVKPVYRKSYPDWMDAISYPRGFKIIDFDLFSGQDNQLTVEHISRFAMQCGNASQAVC